MIVASCLMFKMHWKADGGVSGHCAHGPCDRLTHGGRHIAAGTLIQALLTAAKHRGVLPYTHVCRIYLQITRQASFVWGCNTDPREVRLKAHACARQAVATKSRRR